MTKKITLMTALFLTFMLGTKGATNANEEIKYIEWSWNYDESKLVQIDKTITDYTLLTGKPGEWEMLGSNDDQNDHFYVVKGNVQYHTLNVFGRVHLIICDGATLTCTGGIKVNWDNNHPHFMIYAQNKEVEKQGHINVSNSYSDAAGIGAGGQYTQCGDISIHGGIIDCSPSDGPGIGGFWVSSPLTTISVFGGSVTARGADKAAGIGGGYKHIGLPVKVFGGTINAFGGRKAAGIGNGFSKNTGDTSCTITIYGGTVNATGGDYGAGIGGGCNTNCGVVNVNGGTVNAKGGVDAAGIGGGEDGSGTELNVRGGTVYAEGTGYGAGIGGGDYTGRIEPWDKCSRGFDVNVFGGTVIAKAGEKCKCRQANCGSAIGCGDGKKDKASAENAKELFISPYAKVTGGDSESNIERVFTHDERIDACRWRNYVRIERCTHTTPTEGSDRTEAITYAAYGYDSHEKMCRYCNFSVIERHTYPDGEFCECGKTFNGLDDLWDVTFYRATVANTTNFADRVVMKVVMGQKLMIPAVSATQGLKLVGYKWTYYQPSGIELLDNENESELWKVGDIFDTSIHYHSTYMMYPRYRYIYKTDWTWSDDGTSATLTANCPEMEDVRTVEATVTVDEEACTEPSPESDGQTVYVATASFERVPGATYTFTDRFVKTVYYTVDVALNDGSNNDDTLLDLKERRANVTLNGRTLYHDGGWNTLCLPFDVDDISGTPLEGASVKTLSSATYAKGTLTLNFSEDLTSLKAGKPYIVKWENGNDEVNPVFSDMIICDKYDGVECDYVDFTGSFSPVTLKADNLTVLYMGADNKLYYPRADVTVNACRAYFQLKGITAGEPNTSEGANSIVLNFDGETTGISGLTPDASAKDGRSGYYSIDGRRLNGEPVQKGIYIHNGRKIVK